MNLNNLIPHLKIANCEIYINKVGESIDIDCKGEAEVLISTLVSVLYNIKHKAKMSDDDFNLLVNLVDYQELASEVMEGEENEKW